MTTTELERMRLLAQLAVAAARCDTWEAAFRLARARAEAAESRALAASGLAMRLAYQSAGSLEDFSRALYDCWQDAHLAVNSARRELEAVGP